MKLIKIIANTFKSGELSNEDYHSHAGISGTGLSTIYSKSVLSCLGIKRKPSDALGFGIASHASFMENDLFKKEFYKGFDESIYPDALRTQLNLKAFLSEHGLKLSGSKSDQIRRVKEFAESVSLDVQIMDDLRQSHNAENHGKIEVEPQNFTNLQGMRARLLSDPSVVKLLSGAMIECSVIADVDFFDEFYKSGEANQGQYITCVKIRPDIVSQQFELVDYKTCSDCYDKFKRETFKFNYDMKMALQHDVLQLVYNQSPEVTLLAQNKMMPSEESNPFEYKPWILDQRILANGRKKYLIAIKRWIEYAETNVQIGQGNDPEYLDLNKWDEV